jgi:hypothetical protein
MTDRNQNMYVPPSPPAQEPPPREPLGSEDVDRDLQQTQLSGMTKAAAAMAAILGALLLLNALQLWDVVIIRGVLRFVPHIMVIAGIGAIFLAVKIFRQRVWAVITSAILSAIVALGMVVWFVIAMGSGFISFISFLAPVIGVLSAVFAGIATGACLRTAAARRRLAAAGLDVDF